MIYIIFKD